jgi:hypothetical protein
MLNVIYASVTIKPNGTASFEKRENLLDQKMSYTERHLAVKITIHN